MYNISHFSRTVKPLADFKTNDPLVLNVQFHIVRDNNGDNVHGVEEEDLLLSIARLNIAFNPFNIFFKFRGNTYIDDSEYLLCYGPTYQQPDAWDLRVRSFPYNYDYENINVFVTGIGNQAFFQYSDVFLNHSTVKSQTDPYLIHEFGHALSLLHIFEGTMGTVEFVYDNIPSCDTDGKMAKANFNGYVPNPFYPSAPENVTRDPNNTDDYNADTAGDFVIDTNASFRGLNSNCCQSSGVFTFNSHPDVVDQKGEMYIDLDDERTNYMHYASQINHFSSGQGVRMREAIEDDINGFMQDKLTDVSALYEPYKLEWVPNGGGDDDITLNSGLTFERQGVPTGYYLSYFQPGFDYEIYNCMVFSNGTSQTYDLAFTYEVSITEIPVFNQQGHQIKIMQVGQELSECQPLWLSPNVVGGSVYMQNENIFQQLDSLNINNSYFFNDLPNGIHTININTNTNESIQKTFLKENE